MSFAVYLVHPVYVNLLYKFVKITPFTVLEQCGVQSVAAGTSGIDFAAGCILPGSAGTGNGYRVGASEDSRC